MRSSLTAIARNDDGTFTLDHESPPPDPPPVTTIAWRMAHISIGVLGQRAANHFGEPGSVEYETTEWMRPRCVHAVAV